MSSSKRVLLLSLNYEPEPTGIAPYASALARGLSQRDWAVRAHTAHPHYPEWQRYPGYGKWKHAEQSNGVNLIRLRHLIPPKPTGLLRLLSEISFGARLMFTRWGSPQVVVATSPALIATLLAFVRARTTHSKTPFILWVQDLYSVGLAETGQAGRFTQWAMKACEGWLFRRASHVIAIHDRFASRISSDFNVAPSKITVIRNWTHLPETSPLGTKVARSKMRWENNCPIVLHSGNMGVKQNLESIVASAALASERNLDIKFFLIGDGNDRTRLEALGKDIPNLVFLPPLPEEDFMIALQAADILLVNEKPGISEMAVPSKLTSYFDAGRPVLAATDADGITGQEVSTADAGLIVEPGKPEALLDAVIYLMKNESERERLGNNGRKYRNQILNEASALDEFASLLENIDNK